ncbi:hypothetical protein F4703DRAFT_1798933 [Phycomyces blakesleeanus]|uniref:Uncharacterized protein n=1 Tax=Phycomyces blakesleeanus (strain ATCC 8743b / DSM 1359 / FGSC 10004 / NBRC 33097 / NRRL 1555) TaxID=763407 RepID=A0A167M6Y6_PHYB8|nr:hypothetical protein PHYBLDRAFT_68728 [Phycomyces blakesleeanus NRRL 1555(-)]OAD71987.1 hypothetical protein PHYBLDRAFT_68728 [Phycomyces blakesleeanus NRRL 1555(-)]|eukprot:XP_018290027.1 hypothetical protein PHYBLDRAFT_68728 [Phycomyces blakesleeanus NRRL 1555(-)]
MITEIVKLKKVKVNYEKEMFNRVKDLDKGKFTMNRTEDGYSERRQTAIVDRRRMLLAWGTMILNEYNVDKYVNKRKGKNIVCRKNREWKQDFSCAWKNSPLTTKGIVSHQHTVDVSLS